MFMAKQETVQPRKSRGPVPTGKGTPVQVRLQPDMLGALDKFIATEKPDATRPEALRAAFRDWAMGRGYLRTLQAPEDRDLD
jgi:hypothetical protein